MTRPDGIMLWRGRAAGSGVVAHEGRPNLIVRGGASRPLSFEHRQEGDRMELAIARGEKSPQASNPTSAV